MNDTLPPAALLRNAAALIERARTMLDARWERCDCCGGKKVADPDQRAVFKALENTPDSLRRHALLVEGDPEAQAARQRRREADEALKRSRA